MEKDNRSEVYDANDSTIRTEVLVRDYYDTTEKIEIEQDGRTKEIVGVTINRPPPRRMRVKYNVDDSKHRKIYEDIGQEFYDRWGKRIQVSKKIVKDQNNEIVREEIVIKIGHNYLDWIYLNQTETYILARNLIEAIKKGNYGVIDVDESKRKFIERLRNDSRFIGLLSFVLKESESFTIQDICRICEFVHPQSGRNYISELMRDGLIYKHTNILGGAVYKFKIPRETLERWIKEYFGLD